MPQDFKTNREGEVDASGDLEVAVQTIRGHSYSVISGASADTAVKATPGTIYRVSVWAVGGSDATVKLYDGTAAAGTQIDEIDGRVVSTVDIGTYCATSIHVATVDSDDTLRVTVTYV